MVMFFDLTGYRKRARRELEKALSSISDRLDALETAPPPTLPQEQIKAPLEAIRAELDDRLGAVDARIRGAELGVRELIDALKAVKFAVSEGIERTDRAERRIHATIKRARKELAEQGYESPGLEGEAAELRIVDGDGGEGRRVPPVSEEVERDSIAPSSIRGVPAETLRRFRGF